MTLDTGEATMPTVYWAKRETGAAGNADLLETEESSATGC